jgi:hypothetical protein
MRFSALTRRAFFSKFSLTAAGLFAAGICFNSCDRKNAGEQVQAGDGGSGDSCNDLTGVPVSDIELRKKFAYVDESPIADNQCNNCNLFFPPKPENKCGGCMLFKGPVNPSGYCTYWAPKV